MKLCTLTCRLTRGKRPAILELQGVQTTRSDGERISATLSIEDLQRLMAIFGAGGAGSRTAELLNEDPEDDDDDPDYIEEDEDDETEVNYLGTGAHYARFDRSRNWWPKITEPTEQGLSLLLNGEFGRVRHQVDSRSGRKNVTRSLFNRGLSARPTYKEDIASVRTYYL